MLACGDPVGGASVPSSLLDRLLYQQNQNIKVEDRQSSSKPLSLSSSFFVPASSRLCYKEIEAAVPLAEVLASGHHGDGRLPSVSSAAGL
jgi:hypothetical protein